MKILETLGYTTDVANNGKEALDRFINSVGTKALYHTILMDLEVIRIEFAKKSLIIFPLDASYERNRSHN